jgi:predicted HTH transcriptional regulator
MYPEKLIDLISEGESTILEFKRKATTPEKLAKEISAFANTKGGWLLIGVDDDRKIVGVESEKSAIDIIETACSFFIDPPVTPDIEIINISRKEIVVVYIQQGLNKPYRHISESKENNKVIKRAYIRIGEQSVMASREMARLLKYQNPDSEPLKISIGEQEKRLFVYLGNNPHITVSEFANLVNISRRRAERSLISLVRAGVLQIHNDSTHDYFSLI